MSVSFKLRNADFIPLPKSTVSKPVSSFFASLPIITEPRSFTDIWCFFYLNLFLSLFINLFLGLLGFFVETLLQRFCTILHNCWCLILLATFQLNSDTPLFVNLSCRLNPSLLVRISHPCMQVNMFM